MQPLGGGIWGLGVFIPLLGAGALRLIQEPAVQVTAGDTASLGCQVELAESRVLLRMEWVRLGEHGLLCDTRLDFAIPRPPTPCAPHVPRLQLAWQPPRATLRVLQAQQKDEGRYLCQVILEIPRYGTARGNGTELSVTPAVGIHQTVLHWGLVGGFGGTVLIVGTVLLIRCCCRRRSAVPADTAIYQNVPRPAQNPKKQPPPPKRRNNPYEERQQWAKEPPLPPFPRF